MGSALEQEIKQRLRKSFKSFFSHSIEHLTKIEPDYNDYLQGIFSLQESLEIMVKYYLTDLHGYKIIITEKQRSNDDKTNKDLLDSNSLRTLSYGELIKILNEKDEPFSKEEKELISLFQETRNQIAHMGYEDIPKSVINKTITLIVKVFSNLDFKECIENSDGEGMINLLKDLLGTDLYQQLLWKTDIIKQTEDYVSANYNNIHFCLECENKTVIETGEDALRCLLCGYQTESYYATVIDCPNCDSRNLYLDVLNTTQTNHTNGHCSCCGIDLEITKCEDCGNFYPVCFSCGCGSHLYISTYRKK